MEDIKTNKTLVNILLDRSGSMQSSKPGTISGFNEYLKGLREDKVGDYHLTMIQFDAPSSSPELTIKYTDKPLDEVIDMTDIDFEPRGSTPLYDAVGECIRRVGTTDRMVLVVIITDGLENASQEFSRDDIKSLITEKEKEGWTFVFLGANIDSYSVGASIGASAAHTSNYAPHLQNVMYSNLADSTRRRTQMSASLGVRASAASPMFTSSQRSAMGDRTSPLRPTLPTGGRPSAPPSFRPTRPPTTTPSNLGAANVPRKRREWGTNQEPPVA